MKKIFTFIGIAFITTLGYSQTNSNSHYQQGYYKSDGSYVQGHYKTNSNNTNHDNYSTQGNTNSHTGISGSRARDYSSEAQNY